MRRKGPFLLLQLLLLPVSTLADAQQMPITTAGDAGAPVIDAGEAPSTPSEPADEQRMVVTGSRSERRHADTPVATEVITRAEIERSGAENVAGVLEEHPGVDVQRTSAFGAGIRLQGLDPQYVLILVNGERVAGRINGVVDLTRFSVEDIERIEIVRGPSSALYGADALGGVVNIITRRALRPWEGELHARYGSGNVVDASGRGAMVRGPLRATVTAGYHRRDAYDLDPSDAATNGSAFDTVNVASRIELRPHRQWLLATGIEYFFRDQRGIDTGAGGAVFDRRNRTETLSVPLLVEFHFGDRDASRVRLSFWYTLFRDQFLRDQRGSDALDLYQHTRNQHAQVSLQLDHEMAPGHLFTIGGEGYWELLAADRLQQGFGQRHRFAAFVQDQWTLVDRPRLTLVPGVRVDVDSQFGIATTPKLQLRFDPHRSVALRASAGWGFRAPSFQEQLLYFENPSAGYLVEGNASLRPERSRSFNAGVEWRPGRWLWMSLNAFRNDLDQMIDTVAQPVTTVGEVVRYRYQNIAQAWTMGLEWSARIRPVEALTIDLSYTLTATRDVLRDRPLEGRALHRGNLSFQFREARTGLEAMVRTAIVGPRPFYPVEGDTEAPAYLSLDTRIAWNYRRALTLFVGCDNVANAGDAVRLPIAPRTFYAGATTRF